MIDEAEPEPDATAPATLSNTQRLRTYLASGSLASALLTAWEEGKTLAIGNHQVDIAKVQEWLGHANIVTTGIYDHCRTRPEDSPTFNAAY